MFFQKEKHISWVSVFHSATATAKNRNFHTSNAEWGNWHASTVCLYLSSQHLTGIMVLSPVCFPVYHRLWNHGINCIPLWYASCFTSCTPACSLCLGEETTAPKLSLRDPEARAGVMSRWDWRVAWVSTWPRKAAAAAPDPAASATVRGIQHRQN